MNKTPSIRVTVIVLFVLVSVSMADEPTKAPGQPAGDATVHIVYVDRPESEEAEAFHIRTLAPVVGRSRSVPLSPRFFNF